MIYGLLPEGYLDKVANALRRAHHGYAPHAGPPWTDLSDAQKERWVKDARAVIDEACRNHVIHVRQHAAVKGEELTPDDEAQRVLKMVDGFIVLNFGVSVNLS